MTEQNETFRDRQKRTKAPIQYSLFKGVNGKLGALRLNLKKAYSDHGRDRDDGCIFLEMAPAVGKNVYDWENGKVIMALSIIDIPKILMYLRSPKHSMFQPNERNQKADGKLHIYHDKGAGTANRGKDTTNLTIDKPQDKDNFFWSVYKKSGDTTKTASVTVSHDEALAIGTILQEAIPLLLAWNGWIPDDDLHAKVDRLEKKIDQLLNK
jgi:hypothetical protein